MAILRKSLGLGFLTFLLGSSVVLSQNVLPISDQVTKLNQAVCIQNWNEALRWVNAIIGSSELPNEERSFYVDYRRTLQSYLDRNAQLEAISGCENSPETIETIPETLPIEPSPSPVSNFDWESEVSKIRSRSQSQNTSTLPRSTTPTPSADRSNNTNTNNTPELVLQENQGIFFRPAPRNNIPAASIQGTVRSYLPIEARNIEVYYDVYKLSENNTPNTDNVYSCETTEQTLIDKIGSNSQESVFIEKTDRFVQVVGITWLENGDRAFVRVSQFQASSNLKPCSPWDSLSVYRQAVDPQIGLR